MKRALAILALGALATTLQGAAAMYVPARYTPDLGFLIVVALGLHWRNAAGGLVLAALLGYVTDLFSGSLLGQHVLLRVLTFGLARLTSRQLSLRGWVPLAAFAALLTTVNALALGALTAFFSASPALPAYAWGGLLSHSLANAFCAPPVAAATERLLGALGDEDSGRRLLRLEPRRWSA